MPYINFPEVKEATNSDTLPCGKYLAMIQNIKESLTKNDDEMWELSLFIQIGQYYTSTIKDYLVFNEKGFSKVKKLYKACKLKDLLESKHNCTPSDVIHRQVTIEIDQKREEYNSKYYTKSFVKWAGYTEEDEYKEEFDKMLFDKKFEKEVTAQDPFDQY